MLVGNASFVIRAIKKEKEQRLLARPFTHSASRFVLALRPFLLFIHSVHRKPSLMLQLFCSILLAVLSFWLLLLWC